MSDWNYSWNTNLRIFQRQLFKVILLNEFHLFCLWSKRECSIVAKSDVFQVTFGHETPGRRTVEGSFSPIRERETCILFKSKAKNFCKNDVIKLKNNNKKELKEEFVNSTLRAFPSIQNLFLLIPLVCTTPPLQAKLTFVQITFLLSSACSLEISFLLFSNLANKEGIKEKSEYLMKNVYFFICFLVTHIT